MLLWVVWCDKIDGRYQMIAELLDSIKTKEEKSFQLISLMV